MSEMPASFAPPSRLATLLEVRAPFELASVLLHTPQLAMAPRGDGRPVMLLPGYKADETSLRPLGAYLRYLGYAVFDWGLGRNLGKVDDSVTTLGKTIDGLLETGEAMTMIGWSLGGVVAREVARVHRRNSVGITQPVTSIYSKSDGIVGWRASIDTYNKHARNIAVTSSHLGLGVNPRVWRIIADLLAD
jgi:triacylglycerol esterase/lipase EstA (alpha/beta hydrolase family)